MSKRKASKSRLQSDDDKRWQIAKNLWKSTKSFTGFCEDKA